MNPGLVTVLSLRELPAVAAVHALAEGCHRFIGGTGLCLCICHLEDLALATLHAVGKIVSGILSRPDMGKFCQTQERPHTAPTRFGAKGEV